MTAQDSIRPSPALLSVVIPCFNERATIEAIINRVRKQPLPIAKEIVVVDDGSSDGTRELLRALGESPDLRLAFHEQNRGKCAALATGFKLARGDIVLVQDADLEYDPADYPNLIDPIMQGHADAVFGSRFLGGPHRVLFFYHYVGNKLITLLSNMTTGLNLTDIETGYKAFRREVIQSFDLESAGFGFEPEVTAKVALGGWRVYEVPVSYFGRTYAEGKKITWKDGVRALFSIARFGIGGRLGGRAKGRPDPHRV
jgi:glycosyltransferase involved in cell wall biosynthesis